MSETAQNNRLAVAAIVCGVVGIFVLNVVLGPLAFILGLMARDQIDRSGSTQKGRGMAIGGLVLGPLDLLLGIVVLATL